jgi:hypothetical protein
MEIFGLLKSFYILPTSPRTYYKIIYVYVDVGTYGFAIEIINHFE